MDDQRPGRLIAGCTTGTVNVTAQCEDAGPSMPPKASSQIRDFSVKALNYGYIVNVGCHSFAIETADRLIEKLSEYINNPSDTETKWFKGELFK